MHTTEPKVGAPSTQISEVSTLRTMKDRIPHLAKQPFGRQMRESCKRKPTMQTYAVNSRINSYAHSYHPKML